MPKRLFVAIDLPDATRDRDVRMPRPKLRFDADGQRGFLHALVNLEQMRVRFADADPDNFRRAF